MSAFNRLHAEVRCPNCGDSSKQLIQFKFGDVWQYDYQLGDILRWGGNAVGRPGLAKVLVSGAGEECPIATAEARTSRWSSKPMCSPGMRQLPKVHLR